MIYLSKIILPSESAEIGVITEERRTCFNSFYPYGIFSQKQLRGVNFGAITLFYGGNGSGKSTLVNVIARKTNAARFSDFNNSPFFDKYVDMCYAEYYRPPRRAYVLTSDDVFDYVLNARSVNDDIDDRREALFDKYLEIHTKAESDPSIGWLKGLDDYERWSEVREILSPRRSQSKYVKSRVPRDLDLKSNGESAMRYFLERIEEDALYLLDEPENSLSIEYQLRHGEYIEATARSTRSQFIIATHSPILLAMNGARVYNLDSLPACECKWTELPNVRRFFDFFMSHADEFE